MKDYKRLTNEELHDFLSRIFIQLEPEFAQQMMSVANELLQYRDKIEQGLMKELPCKVGDTVYWCEEFPHSKEIEICRGKVKQITINPQGFLWLSISARVWRPFDALKEDFGKIIFLTKAEAEAKLKELQGDRE